MSLLRIVGLSVAVGFAGPAALAQHGEPAAAPVAAAAPAPLPPIADKDVAAAAGLLEGSFATEGNDTRPSLHLSIARVPVTGLDAAFYYELTRADSPREPFKQGIINLYKRQGALRLRFLDFRAEPGFGGAVTGMWAAPDLFPPCALDRLGVNIELPLEAGPNGALSGKTAQPVPVILNGATEMTSAVSFAPGQVTLEDRGFDPSGKQVWGPAVGEKYTFKTFKPTIKVTRLEGGLTAIDLVSPATTLPALQENGSVAVQYTGWTSTGFQFDTSRQEGRQPFQVQIPGNLIVGWNKGLPGITVGTVRRLVIPGPMAYGDKGNPRARIGPNETLIFEIEALYIAPPPAAPVEKPASGVDVNK